MQTPIHKLFNFGTETARHLFDRQGYIVPMWIGVNKRGSHTPLIIHDMSDKNKVAEIVRAFLRKEGVSMYVSMLECWLYEGKDIPPEVCKRESLEYNPDSREAIHILAEDNGGNIVSGHFYILRPEHGRPKLSPLKLAPEETKSEGRFVRMFD